MKPLSRSMRSLLCGVTMMASLTAGDAMAEGAFDKALNLDPEGFSTINVTVDG